MTHSKRISALAAKLDHHDGRACPECGAREGIEWNGARGARCSYGCHGSQGCGAQWEASDYSLSYAEEETLDAARRAGRSR